MTPRLKPIVNNQAQGAGGNRHTGYGPGGVRYILSVADESTKFGGAYAIPYKDAATVAAYSPKVG